MKSTTTTASNSHGYGYDGGWTERYLFNQAAHAQTEEVRNRPFTAGERDVSALSVVFETNPEVIRGVAITEYSDFADQHGALAVTRVNAIYLSGSGTAFLSDPKLTLHEYYHVLRQWNTGELTVPRYIGECRKKGPGSWARLELNLLYPTIVAIDLRRAA